MKLFPCPYLKGDIELSEEREAHIAAQHLKDGKYVAVVVVSEIAPNTRH